MASLTIQAFIDQCWVDIALLSFPRSDENNYRIVELNYLNDYALKYHDRDNIYAISINHAVSFYFDDMGTPGWLTFLDDIIPSGASRRYWIANLDIRDLSVDEQNYTLLKAGTMSPIGHLRIKDALPERSEIIDAHYFSIDDVKNRASDFLNYAQEQGAIAGGATGAGGEAPKLLLRCDEEQKIWIDTYQDDITNRDLHYLVKYPRGARLDVDCNILRTEYFYYQELDEMGFETISVKNMRIEEGEYYPSLWLPRFDIQFINDRIERFAMESVYSILNKEPGAALEHGVVIRTLIDKVSQSDMVRNQGFQFDTQSFVIEWVKRDLLNILFGNSDNHGRNTSFIRDENGIKLAPIYDFAPMKADPEGIPRTIKWGKPLETGGTYDFVAIVDSLSDLVPGDILLNELKITANKCSGLKERLITKGAPRHIIEMPAIGMNFIAENLQKWGVI